MAKINVAEMIAREIPLSQIRSLLEKGPKGSTAMGDGCGGGCGGGAGCIDRMGYTGVTNAQIKKALKDSAALKKAVGMQARSLAKEL